ncbi:MAG: hypothetical protein F6K56_36305 [Moorea sp. SIO3G5]|nr:hypothetical protein [Moorena sp. SIO3G5]
MKITPLLTPVLVCCIVTAAPVALADSPLTSTPFAKAYKDVDMITYASVYGLNDKVFRNLSNPNITHDVRAAIINQLGFSVEPSQRANQYLEYIARSRSQQPSAITLEMLTAAEALALGYLLAMDDPTLESAVAVANRSRSSSSLGQVQRANALLLLDAAVVKDPEDFSIAFIRSLVRGQQSLRAGIGNWCAVYQNVFSVLKDFPRQRNMRPEAIDVVNDYIRGYRNYCNSRSISR